MNLLAFSLIKTCTKILHNLFVTADTACTWISACNNLTKDCDIRINTIVTLCTRKTDTETCYNFITNKKSAILTAKCLNTLREVLIYRTSC